MSQQAQVTCWPSKVPVPAERQCPHCRLEDSPEMVLGPGGHPYLLVSPKGGGVGTSGRHVIHLPPKPREKGGTSKTMVCVEESSQKAEQAQSADAQGTVAQSSTPGRPGEGTRHRGGTAQGKLPVACVVGQALGEEDHCPTHQKHAGELASVMQGPRVAGRAVAVWRGAAA